MAVRVETKSKIAFYGTIASGVYCQSNSSTHLVDALLRHVHAHAPCVRKMLKVHDHAEELSLNVWRLLLGDDEYILCIRNALGSAWLLFGAH